MLQRCDRLRMAFPADLGHVLHRAELQAMGGAGGHAGRIQSLVHPILAIITLDHLSGIRIPLGCAPGTGGNAGFASDAKAVVHENDAVAAALLHGSGGTCGHTPWIFTVKTGHENIGCPGLVIEHFRTHLDDLAGPGLRWQGLIYFTLNFA